LAFQKRDSEQVGYPIIGETEKKETDKPKYVDGLPAARFWRVIVAADKAPGIPIQEWECNREEILVDAEKGSEGVAISIICEIANGHVDAFRRQRESVGHEVE
jgi:hypothetical protein